MCRAGFERTACAVRCAGLAAVYACVCQECLACNVYAVKEVVCAFCGL